MAKPVLYSYWRSSCSWRVRAALLIKGIDYDYHTVNLLNQDQHSDAYKDVNPAGQIPSLEIDGHRLTDSLAIMEYLDETRADDPTRSLLPANDPNGRALVRALCQNIASGIQPIQNLAVLKYVGKEKSAEWAHHWISLRFEGLEKLMSKTAGKYSYGDSLTMADCCLVPQVYNARRFNVDMSKFPVIAKVEGNLLKHEVFVKSHPSRQPDTPEADRAKD